MEEAPLKNSMGRILTKGSLATNSTMEMSLVKRFLLFEIDTDFRISCIFFKRNYLVVNTIFR